MQRYPADAEVWFKLADSRYHHGGGPGLAARPTDVANALDHALAADSSFAPAYRHRIELAFGLEGPIVARRLISRYLALGLGPTDAQAMRLLDAMLDPARAQSPDVERMLDTLSAEALYTASLVILQWPDSTGMLLRIMRALPRPRPVRSRHMASEMGKRLPSAALGLHGHLREAVLMTPVDESIVVRGGQLGILPDESVRAAMVRSPGGPWIYLPWLAERHDTGTLGAVVRLADSLARLPARGPDRRRSATYLRQAARAALALARHDSAAALGALDVVPDTLLVGAGFAVLRLVSAQLLAAKGRDREAAEVLDEAPRDGVISPTLVLIELERARIAERMGDKPRAAEGYQYVASMWRDADPELQPFVAEAREALQRVVGEPQR